MIAIGSAITEEDIFDAYAGPGIERIREPDTELLIYPSAGSIFRSYNVLLDKAKQLEGLEALVLIHQDAEIVDQDFFKKIRHGFEDPEVALVGCAGATGVRSIAWWEGSVTWASYTHRYQEFGGGEIPAICWVREDTPSFAGTGEVDSIDGFVIAFSPWAIENLRFDETIGGKLHGYDFDISMQVKEAGKKIVTEDLRVIHHHSLELISEMEGWVDTHMQLSRKWQHLLPDDGGGEPDWEERARRAEAELSATRLMAGAGEIIWEARTQELEKELSEVKNSTSWKITRPLRRLRGSKEKNS